jgi:hypothetical protein
MTRWTCIRFISLSVTRENTLSANYWTGKRWSTLYCVFLCLNKRHSTSDAHTDATFFPVSSDSKVSVADGFNTLSWRNAKVPYAIITSELSVTVYGASTTQKKFLLLIWYYGSRFQWLNSCFNLHGPMGAPITRIPYLWQFFHQPSLTIAECLLMHVIKGNGRHCELGGT